MFRRLFPEKTQHIVRTNNPQFAEIIEENLRHARIVFGKVVTDDLIYCYAAEVTQRKWDNFQVNTMIDVAQRGLIEKGTNDA